MRTVTPQFLNAIKGSYRLSILAEVMSPDNELLVTNLPIQAGSVTVDSGSEIRYTCSLTISDIAYLPRLESDPLAPYGNVIKLHRGVRYTNGQVERVPIGVFVIDQAGGDLDIGPLQVTGKGLESVLQANKLTSPYSTAGTTTHVGAITALVTAVFPSVSINSTGVTSDQIPATKTWDVDADRWAACRELAKAIGAECFFDAAGTLVIRDFPPAPEAATPVWEVAAGDGGVMVSAEVTMSLQGLYNGVRCMSDGNATDNTAPVSAQAVDSDPLSPTRWGGPLGYRLKIVKSPLYKTVPQCTAAATKMLPQVLGPNRSVALNTVPNPALEAGDCIRVVYGDIPPELHIVQSLTIPLTSSGDFPVGTRSGVEEVA